MSTARTQPHHHHMEHDANDTTQSTGPGITTITTTTRAGVMAPRLPSTYRCLWHQNLAALSSHSMMRTTQRPDASTSRRVDVPTSQRVAVTSDGPMHHHDNHQRSRSRLSAMRRTRRVAVASAADAFEPPAAHELGRTSVVNNVKDAMSRRIAVTSAADAIDEPATAHELGRTRRCRMNRLLSSS